MDRHVTRWHQMISRDSFGSEILISCHPLEKRSNRLALLGQDWHIGVSGSWNTRLNGANLNGSCKGISSFVRKSIVLACSIGFEKRQSVQGGSRCGGCPHGQLRLCRVPCGPPCGLHFRAQGDFTSWDAAVALSVSTGACLG